jgi:hypothetical protein
MHVLLLRMRRKGVLVWQDMPAMSHEDPFTADNGYTGYLRGEKRQFEQEMKRMVEVRSHCLHNRSCFCDQGSEAHAACLLCRLRANRPACINTLLWPVARICGCLDKSLAVGSSVLCGHCA